MSDPHKKEPSSKQTESEHLDELGKLCRCLPKQQWQVAHQHISRSLHLVCLEEDFGVQFESFLRSASDRYRSATGATLFSAFEVPELLVKPYSSCINKLYRSNVLWNRAWPDEPKDGWVTPDNWFSRFDDMLRTTLIVKYLDGTQVLLRELDDHFKAKSYKCTERWLARDSGYYACHFYFERPYSVLDLSGNELTLLARTEIQITTQLQENIRELLHKRYAVTRDRESRTAKAQWDYDSSEFSATYIGHTLHFLEGLIVRLRSEE